jgi:5-(carboxyamino)imidazole ribonucleotide synthase
MMQPAAIALGIELKVFAESENSSASLSASAIGDYTNPAALMAFAQSVDVITFDHEHVPTALLENLEANGQLVRPGPKALIHAQNKLTMRRKLAQLGLPQPKWSAVKTKADISGFLELHGPEVVVKTPIGGYDGKGVRVISSVAEVEDWLMRIADFGGELLIEEKVNFRRELAQLCARRPSGEVCTWPVVETRQRAGVCSEVIAPAQNADGVACAHIATVVAEGLGVTGVMAVELFETSSGEVLVNELAMRPHNSGHFSIEGSVTSQFEQHLRAVLDLPLGDTKMRAPVAVMLNLLGVDEKNDFLNNYSKAMSLDPELKIHSYAKDPRVGRKMGHVTVLGEDVADLLARGDRAREVLYGRDV